MSTVETTNLREAPELLTVAETATIVRVSRATVYRWIDSGELPALRVGHSLRIDRDELNAWLYGVNREDPNHAPS